MEYRDVSPQHTHACTRTQRQTHTQRHLLIQSIWVSGLVTPSQAPVASCDRLTAENRRASHSAAVPTVMWYSPCRPSLPCLCVCVFPCRCVRTHLFASSKMSLIQTATHANLHDSHVTSCVNISHYGFIKMCDTDFQTQKLTSLFWQQWHFVQTKELTWSLERSVWFRQPLVRSEWWLFYLAAQGRANSCLLWCESSYDWKTGHKWGDLLNHSQWTLGWFNSSKKLPFSMLLLHPFWLLNTHPCILIYL